MNEEYTKQMEDALDYLALLYKNELLQNVVKQAKRGEFNLEDVLDYTEEKEEQEVTEDV